ncbi:MAG: hypothetical protein U0232_21895 [Thermomicrobiales bacterium]
MAIGDGGALGSGWRARAWRARSRWRARGGPTAARPRQDDEAALGAQNRRRRPRA